MLLSYEIDDYQALNVDGLGYTLKVRELTWWGLFDRTKTLNVVVPFGTDADQFYRPKLNVWRYGGKK